ncbi:MAG: site-specific DNA-methyltransferase [Phycisphaerales bacterium]
MAKKKVTRTKRKSGRSRTTKPKANEKKSKTTTGKRRTPRLHRADKPGRKAIEQYDHKDKKRVNNPPVGLVNPETDPIEPAGQPPRQYQYDPHLDPQLTWAGKAERTSFEVPTVSLHVHERIDSKTILHAVRKASASQGDTQGQEQIPLFGQPEENPPLRDAVDFYKHRHNWTNRLIAGDSLLVMNSLLEKEGMGGQVQMVYIDPPYGIEYGSNFQPFVNNKTVFDKRDADLTQEPEMLKAFRDTWELGIHSYLTHLRDRLLLAKELLTESGSCFIQISDKNVHLIRNLMDEVFQPENFICIIRYRTRTMTLQTKLLDVAYDHIVWYARNKTKVKYRKLFQDQNVEGDGNFKYVEESNGKRRVMTKEERQNHKLLPPGARVYRLHYLKPTQYRKNQDFNFKYGGELLSPPGGNVKRTPDGVHSWATTEDGMQRLSWANRLQREGSTLQYVLFHDDYPVTPLNSVWIDTASELDKRYVVQTSDTPIQRCMMMTTDPGDLVFDPTCGSGTTATVAEQWGRRWITTDTSRVATTLARQRLMTSLFDYYELAYPDQGVGSGFKYKTAPHVTLGSIANNPKICKGITRIEIDSAISGYADQETRYDQPEIDRRKARVTGPFTVEAVPAAAFGVPEVRPIDPIQWEAQARLPGMGADGQLQPNASIAREGETLRQSQWREELLKTGIRAKHGQKMDFVRVEPLPGTRWLSADAETKEDKPRRAVVSFGPEHAPLEQRQVAKALEEAYELVPKPALVIFAALQFDPEAAKDIDETKWPGVTMLKAQMNGDLVTEDLKKKRSSNESFWLVGQPDVELRKVGKGADAQWQVEVHGFDYYNPKSGKVEPGGKANIAVWLLDPDYDGRSLYPRQVFFPMADAKDGWARLARNLKAEIDYDLMEQYRGTVSLPFDAGEHERIAVKIVDDRGIESLRILNLPGAGNRP